MKHFEMDIAFRDIVEAARDVIVVTKADPIDLPGPEIVYVNPAFTKLTGYTLEEVVGKTPRILQTSETSLDVRRKIRAALEAKQPVRATVKNRGKSGQTYWLEINIRPLRNQDGKVTHFVSIERDVTEQKELEEKLERLSKTDELTGLANRRAFYETLQREFHRYQRQLNTFTVLMFDLDYFKKINDRYGHPAGDKVLQYVGDACREVFRVEDSVARIGGEEFCIILLDSSAEDGLVIAERLRQRIEESVVSASDKQIHFTISIGVSAVHVDDQDCSDAISRADQALYLAKAEGRNTTRVYELEDVIF